VTAAEAHPALASTAAEPPNSGPVAAAVPALTSAAAAQRPAVLAADNFNTLIRKAALLEKTKGATPGAAWLKKRFGVTDPSQLTEGQRAAATQLAQEIIAKTARASPPRQN